MSRGRRSSDLLYAVNGRVCSPSLFRFLISCGQASSSSAQVNLPLSWLLYWSDVRLQLLSFFPPSCVSMPIFVRTIGAYWHVPRSTDRPRTGSIDRSIGRHPFPIRIRLFTSRFSIFILKRKYTILIIQIFSSIFSFTALIILYTNNP